MELLEPVRIVAVPPVGRSAGRLDEGDLPGLGSEGAEERRGVVGAGAHLGVVRLDDEAAPFGPKREKVGDEILKVHRVPVT